MKIKQMMGVLMVVVMGLLSMAVQAGTEKGDREVSVFVSNTSSGDTDILILQGSFGYFMSDVLEVKGSVVIADSDGATVSGFGAAVDLHFPQPGNDKFLPFVGGGGQLVTVDAGGIDESELSLEGHAGIKQFIDENTSINYQIQFITPLDSDIIDDVTIMSAGLSFIF